MAVNKKGASGGSEFHVILGDIKLSAEAEKRIEAQIQQVVLAELAGYKPNPDDTRPPRPWPGPWSGSFGQLVIVPPIKWPGFIIFRDLLDRGTLKGVQEEFQNRMLG